MSDSELKNTTIDERMRVYKLGYSDSQAAKELGISRTTYTHWRQGMKLNANFARGQQQNPYRGGLKWKPIDTLISDNELKLLCNYMTGDVWVGCKTSVCANSTISGNVTATHWRNKPSLPKE